MSIKERMTPQLEKRFADEIQNTIRKGKERGFLICKDEKGKLCPTKSTQEWIKPFFNREVIRLHINRK